MDYPKTPQSDPSSAEFLQTPYGIFAGVERIIRSESGEISAVFLRERNVVMTHAGDLIPFYQTETPRRKYKSSVAFHPSGHIKSVYLEEQQEIETPIGPLPAEFVTFYETGELKRLFILDGKLSGFWSEADERGLNVPLRFAFSFGSFSAMLVGLCFYPSGGIRSVTLFPGEGIDLAPYGETIPVRNGFSLDEDGALASLEPAEPWPVKTPIGILYAYDPNATGITADSGSLKFYRDGTIRSLITDSDKLLVTGKNHPLAIFSPAEITSSPPMEASETDTDSPDAEDDDILPTRLPLCIDFYPAENRVVITGEKSGEFSLTDDRFQILHDGGSFTTGSGCTPGSGCSPNMCASCKGCPSPHG